jgi:hypothetical protein
MPCGVSGVVQGSALPETPPTWQAKLRNASVCLCCWLGELPGVLVALDEDDLGVAISDVPGRELGDGRVSAGPERRQLGPVFPGPGQIQQETDAARDDH